MMTNDQEAFHAPDEEHHKRALWKRIVFLLGITGLAGTAVGLAIIAGVIVYFSQGLPNHTIVEDYRPKTTTRIYAGDGQLLDEFAVETRIFLPIEFVPEQVRLAFLAAEDQYFYQHFGVNPLSIFRAVVDNVGHVLNGRRTVGASTITQQVAREFLLSGSQSERSIDRKIREALLAIRIEQTLTKDQILELYLNQIYLGLRAYGIAAASLHYFDKPVTDLTIAEAAYLAALPKGPANYHPLRAHENAVARRNWVIGRMVDSGFITKQEATDARQETLIADVRRKNIATFRAEYFVEEVRRELIERYGRLSVYEDGFLVRTSVDSTMQATAERALRFGLLAYDRRHGYAGVIQNLIDSASHPRPQWHEALIATPLPAGTPNHWEIAVVLGTTRQQAIIQTADLAVGTIALDDMLWARERIAEVEKERTRSDSLDSLGIIDQRETTQRRSQLLGKKIGKPSDVLREGDVILVQLKASAGDSQEGASASPTFDAVPITHVDGDTAAYTPNAFYTLEQVPEIEGGIIALDPHTGRILAMSGGWSFFRSQFNRTTQAKR
ncbi:MAG: transglycosylase domain-containing protein, partial [Alphaproteobacteria bacterium]|nr:transglycosylase domain-containing protein [Alphaproteobacteria bacterium]